MIKVEKKENQEILEKSIQHLEARGFNNIKADMEGFESPKSYIKKSTGNPVTPDITATKNGRKYLFDISLKSEKPTMLKSKWVFLDTLSRMKSNRFRIITFRGHYKFTDTLLQELNLGNKQPIKVT
ncbi:MULTISPECIES: hypothetical protein [Robiginitalea]|uniref:Uncharacterized protein n=1 Tax=Robiginitalea biformata (strain ATCC BAA-864 / DSM 15991 / KCTC 12146 / HTCC2501) TaxID=313596 RepID=A4CI55_ROBBH|nr:MULTISPECIES: hypothetical protein [Robiginitalea]EAR16613.1 hypothetical protein RB2501_06925 [Robiginitalea biformata HTCC2501]MDC6353152.1 hypothetical protein [Robiginitalea sp. PM2]MDC6373681.1 hypothetical protein [Robiginitalea sp. SP8]